MAEQVEVPDERLYLGGDPEKASEAPIFYKSGHFTTHGVIVGMTGSGKTGLGVILLEEVLLSGVPALIIDPKGDMGNLLLNFPRFKAEDFLPWVDEQEAKRSGMEPSEYAGKEAEKWKGGLDGWGIKPNRLEALKEKVAMAVYTPGSSAGIPVNVLGSLTAPEDKGDIEVLRDEIESFVTSLLSLIGITGDPLSSREHILLSNLIEHAWQNGRDMDLGKLLQQVQDPPLRKLGVIDLESFFPSADRTKLAMRLNGLMASPSFASWMQGPALDIETLLYTDDGKPRASIMYLAHLSDQEREFVVTLILSKMVSWMRKQSGTSDLRALIYMDEVFGYVPPTKAPPTKKPILTILKQARAFGVGMVLSTQNPVDIDYKALSNTGTWMIGRLQTERDKERLMDGLTSASGSVDIKEIDKSISALGKRQFLLHSTRSSAPQVFQTRWAMSYLRGPMSREEIEQLTADAPERQEVGSAQAVASTPKETVVAEDESTLMPDVADGIPVFFMDPAAGWEEFVPAIDPESSRFAPAIACRVQLLFDDTKADLREQVEWEAVLYPVQEHAEGGDFQALDYDDRDLRTKEPSKARYVIAEAALKKKSFFNGLERELKDWLYANRSMELFQNKALKLYSRVGETEEQFLARCKKSAGAQEDEAAGKLRDKYERKMTSLSNQIKKLETRMDELEDRKSSRRTDELLSGVGSVLTMFIGGRKTARGLASDIRRASSKRTQTRKIGAQLETAESTLTSKILELDELENELTQELLDLDLAWEEKASSIETLEVGLEKTDIKVDDLTVVWVPVSE